MTDTSDALNSFDSEGDADAMMKFIPPVDKLIGDAPFALSQATLREYLQSNMPTFVEMQSIDAIGLEGVLGILRRLYTAAKVFEVQGYKRPTRQNFEPEKEIGKALALDPELLDLIIRYKACLHATVWGYRMYQDTVAVAAELHLL